MKKIRIMVVEDEVVVAHSIKSALNDLGYAVSSIVFSGERVLKRAKEDKPDLVLMDIVLGGEMDGIKTADQIYTCCDIPVVFLTAYADKTLIERAKKAEPFGYIVKPFEERELQAVIEMALYKHGMDKKLRESKEWLSTTLNSIGDAVIATDKEGHVMFMNPVAQDMTGWKEEEAINKPLKDVFHIINEKTGKPAENPVARVLREGVVVGLANHSVLIARDRTTWPIDDSGAPIKDNRGNIIGVVLVFHDITERKKAEEEREQLQAQLIQSEKMAGVGTLASGVAHEFNNLLQIMSGHVQFAERTKKTEDVEEAFNVVISTTNKAKKIIRDLLTFSRVEEAKKELRSIKEPLESVLSLTEDQLKKNNIEVKRKYGKSSRLKINKGEMQQVFLNMVTNARDAMLPNGGRLEINVWQEKSQIKVSFRDTGKGIKKADLDRVFEPFYTTKGALGGDEVIAGTGLGLSVSYGIVKRHGGTIEVESKLRKGTTFAVSLPVKHT